MERNQKEDVKVQWERRASVSPQSNTIFTQMQDWLSWAQICGVVLYLRMKHRTRPFGAKPKPALENLYVQATERKEHD
jgi:hypothetical protein